MTGGAGGVDDLWRERLDPAVDRHVIDVDAALGQQLLNAAVEQAVAQVPAHRRGDHLARKPVASRRHNEDLDPDLDFEVITGSVSRHSPWDHQRNRADRAGRPGLGGTRHVPGGRPDPRPYHERPPPGVTVVGLGAARWAGKAVIANPGPHGSEQLNRRWDRLALAQMLHGRYGTYDGRARRPSVRAPPRPDPGEHAADRWQLPRELCPLVPVRPHWPLIRSAARTSPRPHRAPPPHHRVAQRCDRADRQPCPAPQPRDRGDRRPDPCGCRPRRPRSCSTLRDALLVEANDSPSRDTDHVALILDRAKGQHHRRPRARGRSGQQARRQRQYCRP